jgi:hypothetical protein
MVLGLARLTAVIDLFCGSGGLSLEMAMAKNTDVHKPPLPRVSMGLGNILAQSGVVASAFGRWPGFVLMVLALLVALALGIATAGILAKGIMHVLTGGI